MSRKSCDSNQSNIVLQDRIYQSSFIQKPAMMENIALVTVKIPQEQLIPNPDGLAPKSDMGAELSGNQIGPERRHVTVQNGNKSSSDTPPPTLGVKFVSAGLAACWADLITFPLDTVKVRLQIQGEVGGASAVTRDLLVASQTGVESATTSALKYRGILGTLMTISKEESPRALYNGLVPGLQRQMAFASVRIGLYDTVKDFYGDLFKAKTGDGHNVPVHLRILAGITTGAMAVSCAQPTDVVKVRMQASGGGIKRYNGCIHAYRTIAVQEGMKGLWKGTLPNITRNAIVNAAELVSYDLIKEAFLKHTPLTDNMPCHFLSAFGAGFCTTVVASPVDVVKTRYMNSPPGKYNGAFNCAVSMYQEKGFRTFYKGFMPSFTRLGSWNIVMFVTFEQLKRFFTHLKASDNISTPTIAVPDVNLQTNAKKFM